MIEPTYPLIDLHRHLDGSVRLETILDLGLKHNIRLPATELEALRPHVQVTEPKPGILAFFSYFEWMTGVLADVEACRRIAYENVEDAHREGIDYIELRFSPWFMAEPHELDPAAVVEAVAKGVEEGRRNFDIGVNLIGTISRTYGPDIAWKELDSLLQYADHLVAVDLAGDEANQPGELFVGHFQRAREFGLGVTVHAGEVTGPAGIWQAINDLGATRIGHALSAVEDPELLEYMLEKQIAIESNLTSNVQTSLVSDYAKHPLREFLDRGLLATINSDDPGISGIDLPHVYRVAAPAAGLTQDQIHQAQRNALQVAFLSSDEKQALQQRKM